MQKASLPLKIKVSFSYPTLFFGLCYTSGSSTLTYELLCASGKWRKSSNKDYCIHTVKLIVEQWTPTFFFFFFASPHTTFDYSKRRAFVVSGGRSCSHGNVLGVRWQLLDTWRENRLRVHHYGCMTNTDHEFRWGKVILLLWGCFQRSTLSLNYPDINWKQQALDVVPYHS